MYKAKLLITALTLSCVSVSAQTVTEKVNTILYEKKTPDEQLKALKPYACNFYKSIEDYYNDKPVEGKRVKPRSYTVDIAGVKIESWANGKAEKIKVSELEGQYLTNEQGFLNRVEGKNFYVLAIDGPFCYYIKVGDHDGVAGEPTYEQVKNGKTEANFSFGLGQDNSIDEYYSLTNKGELKDWSNKDFEKLLEENGLMEQYKKEGKPKREMRDTVDAYKSKVMNKKIKYIRLLNEKMSKK